MNRKFLMFTFFLSLILLLGFCNTREKEDKRAQELIDRYIEKIGGNKNIASIKTYKSNGKWMHGTLMLEYSNIVSLPSKMKVSNESANYSEITLYNDGEGECKVNDSVFAITNLSALKSYELDCWIVPLAHLGEIASKKEFIKRTKIGTDDVDEVFIQFKNGVYWNVFFDLNTHLINSIKTSEKIEIKYLKYKLVGDVLFPIEFQVKNQQFDNLKLQLEKIEYNIRIENSEFKL
jgi:hypothetical protein